MKGESGKILVIETQTWLAAIVGAGFTDYVDMCKDKIVRALVGNTATDKLSSPSPIADLLESSLLEIFEKHFAPLSIYPEQERPHAHMLCPVQATNGTGVVTTWIGTAFVRHFDYAFVGTGSMVASNIARKVLTPSRRNRSMREVAGLAIYILDQVKSSVDGCGGDTTVILLGRDGNRTYIPLPLIRECEEKYRRLDIVKNHSLADEIIAANLVGGGA